VRKKLNKGRSGPDITATGVRGGLVIATPMQQYACVRVDYPLDGKASVGFKEASVQSDEEVTPSDGGIRCIGPV